MQEAGSGVWEAGDGRTDIFLLLYRQSHPRKLALPARAACVSIYIICLVATGSLWAACLILLVLVSLVFDMSEPRPRQFDLAGPGLPAD